MLAPVPWSARQLGQSACFRHRRRTWERGGVGWLSSISILERVGCGLLKNPLQSLISYKSVPDLINQEEKYQEALKPIVGFAIEANYSQGRIDCPTGTTHSTAQVEAKFTASPMVTRDRLQSCCTSTDAASPSQRRTCVDPRDVQVEPIYGTSVLPAITSGTTSRQ